MVPSLNKTILTQPRAIGVILEWLVRIATWQLHVQGDHLRRGESAPGEKKLVLPDETHGKQAAAF